MARGTGLVAFNYDYAGEISMVHRTRVNPVLILIPTVLVLLFVIVFVRPVNAGRGIVLRPPFAGIYRVTSYFDHQTPDYGTDGYVWIYNGERTATGTPYPYDGHDGWDFSMNTGTDVLAAASGQVVFRGVRYGNTLVIKHDNDYYTQYSHLDSYLVANGDFVTAGQHIAESGNSGTQFSHLHFTVSHGGLLY